MTTESDPQQLANPAKQPESRQNPGRQQIWASLYLPNLLLDNMQGNLQTSNATDHTAIAPTIAIVERVNNRQQIRSCNAAARKAGIFPGMALNSSYAILPALTAVEYDADKEALLLQQACEWAMQFSSIVCPDGSNHILIEIGGSKRLFDNYASLLATIEAELGKLGYSGSMGIAPTPAGANLLARANIRRGVLSYDRLADIIKTLPIDHLELAPDILEGLSRSGIRSIAQLLEISPASLTRRFGPACSRYLDKLLGRHPDPRTPLRLSETFTRSTTLPIEVHDTNALQFATQRMINELAAFLIARDCGVNQFTVELQHERHDNTRLELRFLQATSRPRHLHRVLSERLSQTQLPAPVSGLHLSVSTFCEIERDASDFFLKSRSQQKSLGEVIDKLTSRLGDGAIYTLAEVDEHRPEKAWKKSFPEVNEEVVGNWPHRPLWLLRQPKPATRPLQLEGDAERIETGWWDNNDVRRDYFIARDRHGTRYWVFQDRGKQNSLFIHGIFS